MSFVNGIFKRIHNWVTDKNNHIPITAERMDEELNDIVAGLSKTLLRDGSVALSGNLKLGNHKIVNVSNGTSNTDVVNLSQLNTKQDKITGAASTVTSNNLPANKILISNNSGKITTSTESILELKTNIINNDKLVHKAGVENITGVKKFESTIKVVREHPNLHFIKTNIEKGKDYPIPEEQQDEGYTNGGISLCDKNEQAFGSLLFVYNNNHNTGTYIRAHNSKDTNVDKYDVASIGVIYPASGNPYALAPSSDVNNSIVTTVSKSKDVNGYFQFGNGMIVNWGTAGDINGYNTITFAKAFTSTNYRVIATQLGSNANLPSMSAVSVTGKTKTTFEVGRRAITAAATVSSIEWIAVGY